MKSIVLFGGSFDPVHAGHESVAIAVQSKLQQRVHFLPTALSPFKLASGASAADRVAMLTLVANKINATVDDSEIKREPPCYTIDTAQYFHAQNRLPIFVIGWDALMSLPQWKSFERLMSLASWIVARRPADTAEAAQPLPSWITQAQSLEAISLREPVAGKFFFLNNDECQVSSTEIRHALAEGKKPEALDAEVYAYIAQHKLYHHP